MGKTLKSLRRQRDIHIKMREWTKAIEIVDEMIQIQQSSSFFKRKGMLLVKLGQHQEAVINLKQALRINNNCQKSKRLLSKCVAIIDETYVEDFHDEENITILEQKNPTALDLDQTAISETTLIKSPQITKNIKLGPYQVLEVIGMGGMGSVHRAYHPELEREVAIKVMHSTMNKEKQNKRFLTEARLMAKLDHPNIVAVHDVDVMDDQYYLVMDYIKGEPLNDLISKKELSVKESLKIISLVALAMEYAHQNNVIHRDLKPSNIIIDADKKIPIIMDFGLAKDLHPSENLTNSGEILGTPRYMSPEQAEGKKDIGLSTDIYAIGAIMYELLTFSYAVNGNDPARIIYNVLYLEIISPRKKNINLSLALEAICLKCLEKNPKNRYLTAKDLATDIERLLSGEIVKARQGIKQRVIRKYKSHRKVIIGIATSLLLVAVIIASVYTIAIMKKKDILYNLELEIQKYLKNAVNSKKLKTQFANAENSSVIKKQLEREVKKSIHNYMQSEILLEQILTISKNNKTLKKKLYFVEKEIGLLALLSKNYILSEFSFARCKRLIDTNEVDNLLLLVKEHKNKQREHDIKRLEEIMSLLDNSPPKAGMMDEYITEMVRMGEGYIVKSLIPYLKKKNKWQRFIAIESLGKIGGIEDDDVVLILIKKLSNIKNIKKNRLEAEKIIWALGRLRDYRANEVIDQFRTEAGQFSSFWNKTDIPFRWIPIKEGLLKTPEQYYKRGKWWSLKGKQFKAIQDFSKAIELDSKYLKAYNARGISYINMTKFSKAIFDYTKIIEIEPNHAKAYSNRGICHQYKNEFAKAISDYTTSIKINPNFYFAYANRAECYSEKKNYEEAINDYTVAIKLAPPNEYFYTSRGDIYRRNNKFKKSISDHTKAIKINPKSSLIYKNRALCYEEQKQFEKAIEDYSSAIELSPTDNDIYLSRANCFRENRNIIDAINDFSIAIKINPKNHNNFLKRARFYRLEKKFNNAIIDYNRALILELSFEGYFYRAFSYSKEGKREYAIKDLESCLEIQNITKKQIYKINKMLHRLKKN